MKTPLSRLVLCAALALAAFPAARQADGQMLSLRGPDTRHTLVAGFGQRVLTIEAPAGMCFLDDTDYAERQAMNQLRQSASKSGKQTLVAAFADCEQLASLGPGSDPASLVDMGMILWQNGRIGETTRMPLADYIRLRAESMPAEAGKLAAKAPAKPKIDKQAHATDQSAAIAYAATLDLGGQPYHAIGVTAATLIRAVPVDVVLLHVAGGKKAPDMKTLYPLADKFVAQQLALNANP
jgi:hypothetical protein